ncbi:hypothetical protein BXZ70DRAFT_951446, partial [Cristinia sonorae]
FFSTLLFPTFPHHSPPPHNIGVHFCVMVSHYPRFSLFWSSLLAPPPLPPTFFSFPISHPHPHPRPPIPYSSHRIRVLGPSCILTFPSSHLLFFSSCSWFNDLSSSSTRSPLPCLVSLTQLCLTTTTLPHISIFSSSLSVLLLLLFIPSLLSSSPLSQPKPKSTCTKRESSVVSLFSFFPVPPHIVTVVGTHPHIHIHIFFPSLCLFAKGFAVQAPEYRYLFPCFNLSFFAAAAAVFIVSLCFNFQT